MATHAIIRIIANSPARHTNQLHLAMLIFEISLVYSLDLKRRQFIASHLASCLPMDLADLGTALAAAAQADTISTDYDAVSEHSCDDTISSTDLPLNPILEKCVFKSGILMFREITARLQILALTYEGS